ncbi:MAG: flagellar hook-associated protein FlgK [Eubacterium sp.]|jgi:flagellar hook-associated protein 1 FlgK|nr:flagellar hook-associated protein FlgK [Eubacterium sp.]
MRSSFQGLEVSKRSIQLSQKALDITNHNNNNSLTPGYTRQRMDQFAMRMSVSGLYQTKTAKLALSAQGTNAFGVAQIRNPYLDKRFRDTTCYEAEFGKKSEVMREVETVLDNIDNVGLTTVLDEFKQAISIYATNAPDNAELSSTVRNQAFDITTMLNSYHTDLTRLLELNVDEMGASVDDANVLIEKIAALNSAILGEYKATEFGNIFKGESVSEYGPLELMDQQNLLIDELSYYGDIHVEKNHDGTCKVFMGNQQIIDSKKFETIIMKNYDDYGAGVLRISGGEQLRLKSGDLKAYQDIVSGNGPYGSYYQNSEYGIPYYISAINTFARDFASIMNTYNGSTEADTTRNMFGSTLDVYDDRGDIVERGNITAETIRISDEWMRDATMIGQVRDPETGEWAFAPDLDGNHANELLLTFEYNFKMGDANDFQGTIYEYVIFMSNRLGQGIDFYDTQLESASITSNELLDSRDAISGVSDTEEGINMMTYQKWFNASSRIMTAMDECLDRIINNMGRVGL